MKENALEEDREERTLEDVFDLLSVGSHFQWTSESHSAKKNTRFDHLLFGIRFPLATVSMGRRREDQEE